MDRFGRNGTLHRPNQLEVMHRHRMNIADKLAELLSNLKKAEEAATQITDSHRADAANCIQDADIAARRAYRMENIQIRITELREEVEQLQES